MLPGDLIYKDVNQDGAINGYDVRPIGYPAGRNPILNYGINASAQYKDFDISMDFSADPCIPIIKIGKCDGLTKIQVTY